MRKVYITYNGRRTPAWQNAKVAELLRESNGLRRRFEAKVARSEQGCWEWTGSRIPVGYGQMWVGERGDGGPLYAHRLAWLLSHGSIPDGLSVLHTCDNRGCVRPDHLFLGTHTDNMRDASAKGRLNVPHSSGRIPDAVVAAIRTELTSGIKAARIAERHGVSKTFVSFIANGKRRFSTDIEGARRIA